nr:hypothetical protein [Candidatus Woesearchaeota archaeon]
MLYKLRKTAIITKEEIIADIIFLIVSFIIAVIALYIFDIHWNFYEGGHLFPPEKHVFTDRTIYLWGGLIGSIIGFFVIKLFLFGLYEEDKVLYKKKN